MTIPTLTVTSNRARALKGHPWVYANEVTHPLPGEYDGGGVLLQDSQGRSLGCGIYNSRSQIIWRRYSDTVCLFDEVFLRSSLQSSISRRKGLSVGRLIWSEADSLPGLVVDRYGEVLSAQALTLAMAKRETLLADLLTEFTGAREIVWRNDAPSRALEGLPQEKSTRSGHPCPPFPLQIEGLQYLIDLWSGHKTGFYLDQREQHPRIGRLAAGRRVLDAFCHQGAFALQCARFGATSVVALDVAAEALALGRRNARANELSVDFREANLFDYFHEPKREMFDLIILDPPSFARNQRALPNALRGYKDLHVRALQRLPPGGILATYCCSQHVSRTAFTETLVAAAADTGRRLRLLEMVQQPADHPVILTMAETEYLKGLVVEVVA